MNSRVKIGELCSFSRGASIPRARMHSKGDYRYIHYGDLYKGFEIRVDTSNPQKPLPFINANEKIRENQVLVNGDIILVLTSETIDDLGHSFLFCDPIDVGAVSGTETTIVKIRDKNRVLPSYLNWMFQSPHFKALLRQYTKGMKVFRVSPSDLAQLEIELPSLNEQKRVASLLDKIFDKQLLNKQLNNNLEQQALLLFKQWFTCFDDCTKDMRETQFGDIPSSFRLMKIGELPMVVADYVANGSFASLKANVTLYQENNYAYFIRNTDLKSGAFGVFVDKHSYEFLSKSSLYGGEIIISNVGDVGSVFLCPKLDKPMTLGNNMIMLRPEQNNLQYYLYIWFKWLYGQSLIQGIKGGSAQPKFNKTEFKNLLIYLPNDNLLEQFHQTVKPIFELIENNNSESKNLAALRDTILPKLMSGELDVSDLNL